MRLLIVPVLALSATLALAGGANVNYLVPAFVACPGPDACGAPQRDSSFTFDTATFRSPRGKYLDPKKPSFVIDIRGVKDANGALVTGDGFTVRISSGQVNVVSLGITLPPGSPLSTLAPTPLPLKNGRGHVSYTAPQAAPSGTVVEGGSIDIYDSAGKHLATVGSQAR